MTQLTLPMLTHYSGPRFVDPALIAGCKTYRDAVRLCYQMRIRKSMTNRQLAEEVGCNPSHVGDYISAVEPKVRRNLPGEFMDGFEVSCGNRAITQWHNYRAQLTILETLIQPQLKAA